MTHPFPRRDLLLSSAGTLFLAPLLRLRRAEAQNTFPRRLVLFFNGNSHPAEFFPTGTGTSFELTAPMQVFAGLEKHMLFTRPIHHTQSFGNHHEAGPMNLFTGAAFGSFGGGRWPTGASIDHVVAPQIFGGVPLKTFHINVQDGNRSDGRGFTSYSGPGRPVAGERDPARIAETIFGMKAPTTTTPTGTTPALTNPNEAAKQKVSSEILRLNTEELRDIQRYLGTDEKAKLDLHVTALQDLGRQVVGTIAPTMGGTGVPAMVGGKCMPPAVAAGAPSTRNGDQMDKAIQSYFDILVAAFRCDQLRVAAVQIGGSGDDYPGFLGFGSSWHDEVAHRGGQGGQPRELYKKHLNFFANRVAHFARQLDGIKEGNGTMLDNTVILWGVEVGINHNHSPSDIPYLVIGGRGMGLKTGQFLRATSSAPCTKLLTGICNALGVPIAGIGTDPNGGPLTGML